MDFTIEFEHLLRRMFDEIALLNSEAAGDFVTSVQEAREKLAVDHTGSELFGLSADGEPVYSFRIEPGWLLLYVMKPLPRLVWIEPAPDLGGQ